MPQSVVVPSVLVCFASLRWNFLFQRPQHVLTRFVASGMRVIYIESKVASDVDGIQFEQELCNGVQVVRPMLPADLPDEAYIIQVRAFLDELLGPDGAEDAIFWYYNPASLRYSDHLKPALVVYDCIGEPENLPGAHPDITALEEQLIGRADLVFTSGHALAKSRKKSSHNISVCTNGIDIRHFNQARTPAATEPEDQQAIPHPRLGYYGVINQHFDAKLIAQVAAQQPDWQFVLIGPVVNVPEEELPQGPNIHYLGTKAYERLPQYVQGWDLGLVPLKEGYGTYSVVPAKVPEYLAAGLRVISSPLEDIVATYGRKGLVQVVSGPEVFINVANSLLDDTDAEKESWRRQADAEIAGKSWDHTYECMIDHLKQALSGKRVRRPQPVA